MKKTWKNFLYFFAMFFIFCSTNTTEITVNSSIQTTSTTSDIPKTIPVLKDTAADLEIGDCFEFDNNLLDYFTYEAKIEAKECTKLHSYEIITVINYKSTDETTFNDDQVPNLEIYDSCVDSYYEKYNRTIAGTLTFISWIGDTDNFEIQSDYLCFVTVPNLTNEEKYMSNIPYQAYLEQFIQTSREITFGELERGSCFNNRTPDTDLINNSIVDLRPCSFPHSNEIVAVFEIPKDYVDSDDIDFWAFDACYTLDAFYGGLEYLEEERFYETEIYIDYVFDDIKWELGESTTIKCFATVYPYQNYSFAWEFDYSITELADDALFGYVANPEEGENRIAIVCPSEAELLNQGSYSEIFVYFQNPNPPIELLEVTISDIDGEHTVDLTPALQSTNLNNEQIVGLTYNIFYLYFMSITGFESIDIIDSGQVNSFIKSISTTFTDSTGVQYSDLCYVEES